MRVRLFAISLGLLGQLSFGQESEYFEFTARAFGDDLFKEIRYHDAEKESKELSFDPRYRTTIQRLPKNSNQALFFKIVTNDRGREQEEPVALADLSGIESRALLIFLAKPDMKRGLPYTVLVADESPGKFEQGHLRFLNLAGPTLMARVGNESFPLEFGFGRDMRFDPGSIQEVPFEFAVRMKEGWKIVYSTGFRAHPDIGTLAILKPPVRADSLRIQVDLRTQRVYPKVEKDSEE